jgi:polyisoprenoid-binding protein YceI
MDLRDNHLRGQEYFDVTKYPRISFVSMKVAEEADHSLIVYGKLTIKNHSKDISFPFTASQVTNGFVFKGSFNISRKDFDVGGSGVISDNVAVVLSVVATKREMSLK